MNVRQTTGTPGAPSATRTVDGRVLLNPQPPFEGVINLNAAQSKPFWTPRVVPPTDAPIPTPALDRIANNGLRYTNFHSSSCAHRRVPR